MFNSPINHSPQDVNASNALALGERLEGVLLGTMVGDALGLPAEGIQARRIARLWPGPWRHHFFFGHGMISDDSEHTLMVGQALLRSPLSAPAFARNLAWRLRGWLLAMPAGVGLATLRAGLKLWLGFPPNHSGVHSAGNGPAMRSALLGVFFADQPERLHAYVEASTRLTHTDPRALTGALAVAHMAALACAQSTAPAPEEMLPRLAALAEPHDQEWPALLEAMNKGWQNNWSAAQFAQHIGCTKGVSGYIYQTVPVAIYAWRRHWGDYAATLSAVLDLGGDTDTAGAIAGGLAGAACGPGGIPSPWLTGLIDWPRSTAVFRRLARGLAQCHQSQSPQPAVRYFWPALAVRNLVFLFVVLAHGLRRGLPPY